MTIPKTITIKGKQYQIVLDENLKLDDGTECDGICDLETRTIYLDQTMSKKNQKAALLHEVFHALIHESHCNDRMPEEIEEVLCDAFSDLLTTSLVTKWKK